MDRKLGRLVPTRRAGDEPLTSAGSPIGPSLIDFWTWSGSDLVSNTQRGILAEYIVAVALGIADGVRDEWAAYDLETADGIRVEVKSAAYVQSWAQKGPSAIQFKIGPTRAWDADSNVLATESLRHANVYVFCLLSHGDQATINPLELDQWDFFVAATHALAQAVGNQRTIGLTALKRNACGPVKHAELPQTVRSAYSSTPMG